MIDQVRPNLRSNGRPGCSMNRNPLVQISRTIGHDGSWPWLSRLLRCKRGSRCIHGAWSAFGRINGGLHVVERIMASHERKEVDYEAIQDQTATASNGCVGGKDRTSSAQVDGQASLVYYPARDWLRGGV